MNLFIKVLKDLDRKGEQQASTKKIGKAIPPDRPVATRLSVGNLAKPVTGQCCIE